MGADGLRAWASSDWPLAPDWQPLWRAFCAGPAGRQLGLRLQAELAAGTCIYPAQPLRALALTPLNALRVVIVGQDPYHGPGQADGLAFSVPAGVPAPPSLRNIRVEVQRSLGTAPASLGSLEPWAQQGVLLLNTCLTVRAGAPASHAALGWQGFTHALLQACAAHPRPKAFLLWGAAAQTSVAGLDLDAHLVLRANHPSPLAARRPPRPFIGCDHFASVNRWLQTRGEKSIAWA